METPIEEQQREAKEIKNFLESEAWNILNKHLTSKSKELTAQLIESDGKDDFQTKADIRAIKTLIDKIIALASVKTN